MTSYKMCIRKWSVPVPLYYLRTRLEGLSKTQKTSVIIKYPVRNSNRAPLEALLRDPVRLVIEVHVFRSVH
jgi:hypothetical protein